MADDSNVFSASDLLGPNGLGGAVSELFGAVGDEQAAAAYTKEAQIAGENANIAQTSANIQTAQEARAVTQAIGSEEATTASGGFTMGGNASDLLRQSLQQGALATSLVKQQGAINVLGYQEQEQAAQGKAAASKTAGTGGFLGGALKIGGAIAGLFSDRRLKQDIEFIGILRGFNIYRFRYIGEKKLHMGVMADEVEKIVPDAVHVEENGYKSVDYALIGLEGIM